MRMSNHNTQNDESNPPQQSDFVYPQQLPGLGNFAPMQHQSQTQPSSEAATSINDIKRQLHQLGGTGTAGTALLPGQLDPSTSAFLSQLFMDSSKQQQQQQQQNQSTAAGSSTTTSANTPSASRLETPLAAPFALATGPITAGALTSSLAASNPLGVPLLSQANTTTAAPAPSTTPGLNQAMMMSVLGGDPRLLFAQNHLQQQPQQQQPTITLAPAAPAPTMAPTAQQQQQQEAGEMPLPSPHSLFHRDGSRRMRGGVIEPFPEKLHRLLLEVEQAGRSDVISFVASGRAFAIHKPDKFFKEIVPLYFRQSRLSSFKRQLNLYGFELINAGPARGGYFHDLFQKDHPELCRRMRRVAIKVSGSGSHGKPKAAPERKPSPEGESKSSKAAMEALLSNDVELPPGDSFSHSLPSGEQRRLDDLA